MAKQVYHLVLEQKDYGHGSRDLFRDVEAESEEEALKIGETLERGIEYVSVNRQWYDFG